MLGPHGISQQLTGAMNFAVLVWIYEVKSELEWPVQKKPQELQCLGETEGNIQRKTESEIGNTNIKGYSGEITLQRRQRRRRTK